VQVPLLSEIRVAARAEAWADAGFDTGLPVGGVTLRFVGGSGGIVDWALTETRGAGIDGLPTRLGADPAEDAAPHPNGVSGIDHIVVLTPQLERTTEALEAAGIELRRRREGETGTGQVRTQAFFRLGKPAPFLEVVEAHELNSEEPARFWGITFVCEDLDLAAAQLGDRLGRIKDAVQPGRQIATVRREAELGLPVALITPHVKG
jgi:hypothetical protein